MLVVLRKLFEVEWSGVDCYIMVDFLCAIPSLKGFSGAPRVSSWDARQLETAMRGQEGEMLGVLIARMGELSAIAQQLHAPITNCLRILQGPHKLYLLTSGVDGKQGHIRAMGILKVGKKNLFIRRRSGELVEMAPLCVLDFYVHESCQRQGLGHQLFEHMLEQERKRPCELGYDRPSSKLLSFMAKYYNLTDYINQANQFVVYNDYFKDAEREFKENYQRDFNKAADAAETTYYGKERARHGRRADARRAHELTKDDEYHFTKLDNDRLVVAHATNTKHTRSSTSGNNETLIRPPCYQRGRRNLHCWAPKENHREGKLQISPNTHPDHQASRTPSPQVLKARRSSHLKTPAAETTRNWNRENHEGIAGPGDSNTMQCTPGYNVIDEVERARIQNLCLPSMELVQAKSAQTVGQHHDSKHVIKPAAFNCQSTKQAQKSSPREPPLSYPFWTEAKELAGSHTHMHRAADCNNKQRQQQSPVEKTFAFHNLLI